MLKACTPNPTEIMAAMAEPIMPHTSGKAVFQVDTEEGRLRNAQVTGDAGRDVDLLRSAHFSSEERTWQAPLEPWAMLDRAIMGHRIVPS